MRILILSDLHLEVWRDSPRQARELLSTLQPNLRSSQPDLVILAGDVDKGDRAVAWADRLFPELPVIYVHGNHEAYGQKIDTLKVRLAEACSATGHVHFLDKHELVIGNVRFLGATLWTDFQLLGKDTMREAMQSAGGAMNDYRKIRLAKAGYRKIRPLDAAQWHWEDRIWLDERLAEPFSGPTVVVTHMAPSLRSIPERYQGQLLSAAFASAMDDLVSKADLWVHGHVHESMDYLLGKARVVCNPLGYPQRIADGQWVQENELYDPNLIVEIGMLTQSQQILVDAATLRQQLAAEWLDAEQVGARLNERICEDDASLLRREGRLLGVYVTQPAPGYRYAPWQFGLDGQPVDQLSAILKVLRDFGPFERETGEIRRSTGWGEIEWFLSPHELLDGVAPAEILAGNALRVLEVARIEFENDA